MNKRINDGIRKNPNQTKTNLSGIGLNDDEIAVFKLGLKHGLFIRPEGANLKKVKYLQLWRTFMTKLLAKIF